MANNWSRNQILAALNLYFQIPSSRHDKNYLPIVKLAEIIGRSPGSLAMKLRNFTALDPSEQERGISGLPGGSRLDKEIWESYYSDFSALAVDSEKALESFALAPSVADEGYFEIQDTKALVRVRRQQRFFRRVVLSSYGNSCAISSNPIPELLIASHIKPWAIDRKNRANPRNGICLAGTYDRAFDTGLICISDEFKIQLSGKIEAFLPNEELTQMFLKFEGCELKLPDKNLPDKHLLEWHRTNIFRE